MNTRVRTLRLCIALLCIMSLLTTSAIYQFFVKPVYALKLIINYKKDVIRPDQIGNLVPVGFQILMVPYTEGIHIKSANLLNAPFTSKRVEPLVLAVNFIGDRVIRYAQRGSVQQNLKLINALQTSDAKYLKTVLAL